MSATVELDVGLVVAGYGRHYVVETPEGERVTCHPRGKKSECVVGDRGSGTGTAAGFRATRSLPPIDLPSGLPSS